MDIQETTGKGTRKEYECSFSDLIEDINLTLFGIVPHVFLSFQMPKHQILWDKIRGNFFPKRLDREFFFHYNDVRERDGPIAQR